MNFPEILISINTEQTFSQPHKGTSTLQLRLTSKAKDMTILDKYPDPGASWRRERWGLPKYRGRAAWAGYIPLCHVMVSGSISSLANLFISSSVSVVGSVFSMPSL